MSVETMLQEGSKDRNPVTEKLRDAFISVLKNQRSTALDTVASLAAEREVLSDRIAQLTAEREVLADRIAQLTAEVATLKQHVFDARPVTIVPSSTHASAGEADNSESLKSITDLY